MKRPPESMSIVAPAIAAAAGGRAGTCMIAAPSLIVSVCGASQLEHRDDVGAVALGHPDRLESVRLGRLDQIDRFLPLRADPPVPEVDPKLRCHRAGA